MKWEYLSQSVEFDLLGTWLQSWGRDGWELVSITNLSGYAHAVAKRPLRRVKREIPPPGRKLGRDEALARTNEKFGPAFEKLAKS